MRIICPKCDAQYEVPDDVISEEGRDVQCSNCANTWFQKGKAPAAGAAVAVKTPQREPEPAFEQAGLADLAPLARVAARRKAAAEMAEPVAPPPGAPAATQRQPLDPKVADILRQEGEREAAARAADAETPAQRAARRMPDHETERERRREVSERMDRIRIKVPAEPESRDRTAPRAEAGTDDLPDQAREVHGRIRPGNRRDLLPDVEELNSSLRSKTARAEHQSARRPVLDDDEDILRGDGGFGRGFMLAVVIFAVAALAYAFAPAITSTVPVLEPALSAYVDWVNQIRSTLDGEMRRLLQWLDARTAAQA